MSLKVTKLMFYHFIHSHSLVSSIKKKCLFLQNHAKKKRHPYSSLSYKEGTYTVEAAVVLPLFLIFGMLILFCMKTVYTQWKIGNVLDEVADTAALYGEEINEAWIYGSFYALAAKEDVPTENILGGMAGIGLLKTTVDELRISVTADYYISYPITILGWKGFYISQRRTSRIWNGYDPNQTESSEAVAYVTKYGTVYHLSASCPHIDLSVRSIAKSELSTAKNSSGARYRKCPLCGKGGSTYYVTSWGDCYHSSLSCSGLKRIISKISLEKAKERYRPCSKCASGS